MKKFMPPHPGDMENKGVEDLGGVIREGGGALAKGLFRGVTGILTKPPEEAKNSGFVQGVGKGITGAAPSQSVGLPCAITGDDLLRPYNDYKAQGQLAESVSIFSQVDLFKVRGKFALSDAYEDHFMLPERDIIVVTHRRVVLNSFTRNISAVFPFLSIIDHCKQGLP